MEKIKQAVLRYAVVIVKMRSHIHPEHVIVAVIVIGKETAVMMVVETIKAVTGIFR